MAHPVQSTRGGTTTPQKRRMAVAAGAASLALVAAGVTAAGPATAHGTDRRLAPRTHFTMKADGSSGLTAGGEGIPNIDSVKKTIYAYYGDPAGTGNADPNTSPYISEVKDLLRDERSALARAYAKAVHRGKKPAIVFDADDTTLWTYQMEVGDMKSSSTTATGCAARRRTWASRSSGSPVAVTARRRTPSATSRRWATATPSRPTASSPSTTAARLRPRGWRGLVARFGSPEMAFTRPLAAGLATLGIAGLLLTSLPLGLPGASSTSERALSPIGNPVGGGNYGAAVTAAPAPAIQEPPPSAASSALPAGAAPSPAASAIPAPAASDDRDGSAPDSGSPSIAPAPPSGGGGVGLTTDGGSKGAGTGADLGSPAPGGPTASDAGAPAGQAGPSPLVMLSLLLLASGLVLGGLRLAARRLA